MKEEPRGAGHVASGSTVPRGPPKDVGAPLIGERGRDKHVGRRPNHPATVARWLTRSDGLCVGRVPRQQRDPAGMAVPLTEIPAVAAAICQERDIGANTSVFP
jgi:hypothetical protein